MIARKARGLRAAAASLGFGLMLSACGDAPTTTSALPPPPPRRLPPAASAAPSSSAPKLELSEGDFTPSDQSRDPFRGYADLFVATAAKKTAAQQKIVAERYSLDELKLVAVVTGNTAARAMFVDPTGKGHVVTRGELVGRAESVKSTAAKSIQSYETNWRVDRIREGDVVFVREDPERPNVPAATRVIALRPEGDPPPARRLRYNSSCFGVGARSSRWRPPKCPCGGAQVGLRWRRRRGCGRARARRRGKLGIPHSALGGKMLG